jgi:hypothetical protein
MLIPGFIDTALWRLLFADRRLSLIDGDFECSGILAVEEGIEVLIF